MDFSGVGAISNMNRIDFRRFRVVAVSAFVLCAAWAASSEVWAQGDGLTGRYYQWPAGTPDPPPPAPGSPEAGAAAWTVTATRIDPTVNFANVGGAPWAPAGVGPNTFTVAWTGYVLTGVDNGTYTFTISIDDGGRLWVANPMTAGGEVIGKPGVQNSWIPQAVKAYSGTINLLPNTFYPIRFEFYQDGGNTACQLQWASATVANVAIPTANLFSDSNPSVCLPPSGLTATGGFDKAVLNWTAGTNCTT